MADDVGRVTSVTSWRSSYEQVIGRQDRVRICQRLAPQIRPIAPSAVVRDRTHLNMNRENARKLRAFCQRALDAGYKLNPGRLRNSENSKANRIEPMKGPAESGQICSVGRRKIAKKIAKNQRCYANTLRPRSRMLLKVMKGG